MVVIDEEDDIVHYGILRRSGRYPWNSGGQTESQRNKSFLDYIQDLFKRGFSEVEVARALDASTTELRAAKTMAKNQQRQEKILMAQRLKEKGYSNVAIGERMGINESSVRSLLAPGASDKADKLTNTANMLKDQLNDQKYLDVGSGVENHVGVSDTQLKTSLAMLQEEGYEVHRVKVEQLGTGNETDVKVLAPPGTTQKEVWLNQQDIGMINKMSDDNGRSFYGLHDPISVDPKRLEIRYAEDGGATADGVIYVRPGADQLDMGGASYAQVRIKVGEGHYLKGMAMYKNDLPDGTDLMFNTNKTKEEAPGKLDALKALSDDPDNPFGAVVNQLVADKGGPDEHVTSAMNIVREEGEWGTWSKSLATQVLSKQKPTLAKQQLDMTYEQRLKEFNEISDLTNPTVRKKMLEEFADGTDAAAVHLKAKGLPRQAWHVILPVDSIGETEVYAPNYRDGERVALIRYPHGGAFEIPELTVNNRHPGSKDLLGQAKDAIGINHKVAERLSGADFDGDTVLVIPNNSRKIESKPALADLKSFDPRSSYPAYEGMKKMTNTQTEMGKISNLITDMTIRNASQSEIARAVKHSMVVIDAEKHGLDYKSSARDNGITQLKAKYQRQDDGKQGAATLISRASSDLYVPDRKARPMAEGGPVDTKTGKKVYVNTGKTNSNGKLKTVKSTKLGETDDAHTLSSGTRIERLYADHSNKLKSLANRARLDALNTPPTKYSPSAKKTYSKEVDSLDAKLNLAKRNRPLERQAQIAAKTVVKAKRDANPDMDYATRKKIEGQALTEMRNRTGAGKQRVKITPNEWDAIQAGAISENKLSQILRDADMDTVRDLATPRTETLMTSAKSRRAQSMLNAGYTRAQVADQLGVSLSTLGREIDS